MFRADLCALTSGALQTAGAAGSSHCRPPSAICFAVPAASCADKIERRAEKRLFWQLVGLPEFRCGSTLDYTRMAAAFNREAADQACAVYREERPPPHEQDTLRFIDAHRLREFHEDVLKAGAQCQSAAPQRLSRPRRCFKAAAQRHRPITTLNSLQRSCLVP